MNLSQSDEVILYVDKKPYHYRVVQKVLLRERGMPSEVRRQNAEWIVPTDHERLTMVTCWPYSSNTTA